MRRPARDVIEILAAGLFASPAAAMWLATGGLDPAGRRWRRGAAVTASAAVAAALVVLALPWERTAVLWALFSLAGAGVAMGTAAPAPGEPDLRDGAPEGERRDAVRAIAAALLVVPPLAVLLRLAGVALLGRWLARLDPQSVDPNALAASLLTGVLWAGPAAGVFAAIAARRGRLSTGGDVVRAVASWTGYLLAFELVVLGGFRALDTQLLAAERAQPQARVERLAFAAGFALASVPVSLALAWGRGPGGRRLLRVAALFLAALASQGLLTGIPSRIDFVRARRLEREGRLEGALAAYGRSLRARSSPLIESYLQHRIGLLHYKLGDEERAAAAFRLVRTSRNAHPDLVREAGWYLERLASPGPRRRVVLPGVEIATEHRDAYCAPNTLALVLRAFGRDLAPGEIGEEVAWVGAGTAGADIDAFLDRHGFEHRLLPWSRIEDLRWLVERGLPALVYVPQHVLAVFGYDDRLGTVVTYDTAVWDIWVDQPVEFFEERWGQRAFELGVVLPRAGGGPAVEEARRRFDPALSSAARHFQLYWSERLRPDEDRQLEAALEADPGWFSPTFRLVERGRWRALAGRERAEEIARRAREALSREHLQPGPLSGRFGHWLLGHGRPAEVLEVAAELEARDEAETIAEPAAIAAARLGRWERATFLADRAGDERSNELRRAWLRALLALGDEERAVEVAEQLAWNAGDDSLEEALEAGERLAAARDPARLERLYMGWLGTRRDDFARQLRFAEAVLAALARPGEKERRERLQRARRAVEEALAYGGDDPAVAARASALAARIDGELRGAAAEAR